MRHRSSATPTPTARSGPYEAGNPAEVEDVVADGAPDFQALTGATVNVITVPFADLRGRGIAGLDLGHGPVAGALYGRHRRYLVEWVIGFGLSWQMPRPWFDR